MKGFPTTYQICRPIPRHEVAVACLPLHSDIDFVVVCGVAGEVPVLDQGHEHRASFPPGIWDLSGDLPGLVAVIMGHHAIGGRAGCILDRFCVVD